MLSVGCQVGRDYRCTILYLVARRYAYSGGSHVGPLSLTPQYRTGGGYARSGIPGFVLLVGVFRRRSQVYVMMCVFSSHLRYI